MNKDEILLDILRTGRRWHQGKLTLDKAENVIKEDIDSYNAVKNLTIPCVIKAEGDSVCDHPLSYIERTSKKRLFCHNCGVFIEQTGL